jgi:heptosyltransferase-2
MVCTHFLVLYPATIQQPFFYMNESIAVFTPRWLGDYIMTLSVVMYKRIQQPDTHITLLIPDTLAALHRCISDLPAISYNRRDRSQRSHFFDTVRRHRVDTLYILPTSFASAWMGFRTGIATRRGIAKELRGCLLTDRVSPSAAVRSHHLTAQYARVLSIAPRPPAQLPTTAVAADTTRKGCVVLCPDAAYGPAKRWDGFAELAALVEKEHRIVLLGTDPNASQVMELVRRFPHRVENLVGKTSLPQAAAICAAARCVVSNDSGLMHLAAFTGAPVIGLFLSTSPEWTRPVGTATHCITSNVHCRPCFTKTCRFGTYACRTAITPTQVYEQLQYLTRH